MCPQCAEYNVPRPLEATSDDRQWLAVLDPNPVEINGKRLVWWTVYHWEDTSWDEIGCEPDTGQSAEDVVREWQEDV